MPATFTKGGFQRRVIGIGGDRLDGLTDILARCVGASVLDIGCNRGMVAYDLALHGARLCHGCDLYETGMLVANEVFADLRNVEARFEVVDLEQGGMAIERAFGSALLPRYDFVIFLAVYHKLRRAMPVSRLLEFVDWLARRCGLFLVWRGSIPELREFEPVVTKAGFRQVHYSEIAELVLADGDLPTPQPAVIWKRQ